jgi:hypothetical protein
LFANLYLAAPDTVNSEHEHANRTRFRQTDNALQNLLDPAPVESPFARLTLVSQAQQGKITYKITGKRQK